VIVSDGSGGAIVSWMDVRSGADWDIFAQRISATGSALWAGGGVAVCTAANNQFYPIIASDGSGGAIVAWQDLRSDGSGDIYAQRVGTAGFPMWTANGVPVVTATDTQQPSAIIPDGAGGAIIAWADHRTGAYDEYAQRLNATGAAQWAVNGALLSGAYGDQSVGTLCSDGANGALVTWTDSRNGNNDLYAQRIERSGQLGDPEPVVTSVGDVPNDQGGKVKVAWTPSYLDVDPTYAVSNYLVWRSVPPNVAAEAVRAGAGAFRIRPGGRTFMLRNFGAQSYAWEFVASVGAVGLPAYSMVVPTTADSVAGSNPLLGVMVEAQAYLGNWFSAPDSGYSVDNLPPARPAPFTATYAGGTASLHWGANTEADFALYRLCRGTTAAFVPGPANLVATPSDTGYVDIAGQPYFYKLAAEDVHGNLSVFALAQPSGTSGVDGGALPRVAFLAAPSPNPSRAGVALRFGLPRDAWATLAIFDQQGRRVRALVSGVLPAGSHAAAWDGRDDAGLPAPSGLYFARLDADGRTFTTRLTTLR